MKRDVVEFKNRISAFIEKSNLDDVRKSEFYTILEEAGKFKTGSLIIEEKTFREYIKELLVYKFLFIKNKDNKLPEKITNFILDFFSLIFPEINKNSILIEIKIGDTGGVEIIERNDTTVNLFNTIVATKTIN